MSEAAVVHETDVGLGTAYERVAVYRLLARWLGTKGLRTAFEGPVDGMAGIAGLHLLGLARRGTKVTVALPDEHALEVVRGVYRRLGVEDRLRTLKLGPGDPLPDERFDAVLTYNALPLVDDWRGYLARLAPLATRYLVVSVTNPHSYGVAIRRVQRMLETQGEPELFDHESTRPEVLRPVLEPLGKIADQTYVDCPWWPDLFVPTGLTLWEAVVGRLPLVGGRVTATAARRAMVADDTAGPAPRPHAYGAERFPLFDDDPDARELAAVLRHHPLFDERGRALGKLFGHHRAYLVVRP